MQRVAVGLGIDRDRLDAHPPRGLDDPAGDLAAIGDQNALEHAYTAGEVAWLNCLAAMQGSCYRRPAPRRMSFHVPSISLEYQCLTAAAPAPIYRHRRCPARAAVSNAPRIHQRIIRRARGRAFLGGSHGTLRSTTPRPISRRRPPKARSASTTGSATTGRCCSRIPRISRRSAPPSSATWPRSSRSSTSAASRSSASRSIRSTGTPAGPPTSRRRRASRRTTR